MKLIDGSSTDYITKDGKVFKTGKNGLFEKAIYINPYNGYSYCGITYDNEKENKTKRVHKLVANAYIENPEGLPVVGHKNNIKHDNRVENLYWTTISENTKKAYEDGLARNDKGAEDSQSKSIESFVNGESYKIFGSMREASRELNIPLSTVLRRLNEGERVVTYRKHREYTFKYI